MARHFALLLGAAGLLGECAAFVPSLPFPTAASFPPQQQSRSSISHPTSSGGVAPTCFHSQQQQHLHQPGTARSRFGSSGGNRRRGAFALMASNLYDVLGVPQGSEVKDVKRAYRKLARQYHPDVNPDPGVVDKFKEMTAAYNVLSDPEQKQRYDMYGEAGIGGGYPGGGGGGVGIDLGDLFETFFGGGGAGGGRGPGGGRQPQGPQRGDDLRVDLDLSFNTACFGGEEKVRIRHFESCNTCTGSGVKPGAKVSTCQQCGGQGVVMAVQRTPLGNFQSQTTCPACRGTGEQVEEYCGSCSGKGVVERSKQVKVRIPAGVDEGNKLRVKGEGDAGPKGGPSGDLYVFISVARDKRFRREGTDIFTDVPVSYLDAILGNDEVLVTTIDGDVQMKIPAGTQPNTTLRIRGKGVPSLDNPKNRGDQYVNVKVEIPLKPTKEEAVLYDQLKVLQRKQGGGSGNRASKVKGKGDKRSKAA